MNAEKATRPVLVTGATGFPGGAIARALLGGGAPVRALGRDLAPGLELAHVGADFRPVDVRDRPAARAACKGVVAAVHTAPETPGDTQNLIEGCLQHKVEKLVCLVPAARPELAEKQIKAANVKGLAATLLPAPAPNDAARLERLVEQIREALAPYIPAAGPTVPPATETETTAPPPTPLAATLLRAGSVRVRERLFQPGGRWHIIAVPALFGILEHPEKGPLLFDTGYARRFFEGTRPFPFRLLRWLAPPVIPASEEAFRQVRARGIEPEAVPWILLSHFDPDHYGGLQDFPNARIICTSAAWESAREKVGWAALRARVLPGHLPEDTAARLWLLPEFTGPAIGPFPHSHDLFGDGALRLVALPGHAPGQIGAFLRTQSGNDLFLCADACWNRAALRHPTHRGGLHHGLATDRRAQRETYARLRQLQETWPALAIIPAHCPEAWRDCNPEDVDTRW